MEEKVTEQTQHSIAWDLLEMHSYTMHKLIKSIVAIVVTMSIAMATTAGIFVWYLNQYDFSSSSTETTTTTTNSVEATTEGGGDASAIINDDGEVTIDGEGESEGN